MNLRKVKNILLTIMIVAFSFVFVCDVVAFDNPLLVTITTQTCYSCQKLKSVIEELEYEYYGRVDFLTLDVSNKYSIDESRRATEDKGIIEFFEENKGAVPRVGILCPGKTKAENIFTGETRKEVYKEVLDRILLDTTSVCSL